ncbi:MAG: acyltransferase [Anaerolineae bacterium]|nr:acyltransferase [Anaerolineae bacterium]
MFKRLLFLNGLATMGLILFHSAGWGFVAMYFWRDRYLPLVGASADQPGGVAYYVLRAMEQVPVATIPAFLFVSGVFVAFTTRQQGTVQWPVVRRRLQTLLIPYFLWSALLLVLLIAEGRVASPARIPAMLLTGATNPAYYYVPLLTQFYLLSFWLVPLARRRPVLLLIVAAVVQSAVQLGYYLGYFGIESPLLATIGSTPKWFFVARLFWFSSGVVAGFNMRLLESWLHRRRWVLAATTALLVPVAIVEWEWIVRSSGEFWLPHRETFVDTLYSLFFILAVLAFFRQTTRVDRQVEALGLRSYGIYLVHSPVMEYTARAVYHLAPAVLASQLLLQPLLIVAGLGVPLAAMAMANRLPAVQRYYKYGFG